jgi:hypothetical protein
MKLHWLDDVEEHDYGAALAYLSLKLDPVRAASMVTALRALPGPELRRANDILRACGLPPLPRSDPGVSKHLTKDGSRKPLSPVLVVSFDDGGDIADGYHRVSVAYQLDPYALVPARIAAVSRGS